MTKEETSASGSSSSPNNLIQTGSCGKTSPEYCPPTTTPSVIFSVDWLEQRIPSRTLENGRVQVWLLAPDELSAGGCSMPNTSECPNAVVESSLWEVLDPEPIPDKYYLSSKAARGILKRAQKQGKRLITDQITQPVTKEESTRVYADE